MEILLLILLLQVKHYYADFAIQSYEQTIRKGEYGNLIGISHSCDHIAATLVALLLANFFIAIDPKLILILALAEGIAHYHIDWVKMRFGSKNMHSALFWNQFGLDQLAHQATYLLIAYFIITAQ